MRVTLSFIELVGKFKVLGFYFSGGRKFFFYFNLKREDRIEGRENRERERRRRGRERERRMRKRRWRRRRKKGEEKRE